MQKASRRWLCEKKTKKKPNKKHRTQAHNGHTWKVASVQECNVVFVVIMAQFWARGGGSRGVGWSCSCLKSPSPALPIVPETGVCGGEVGGHAESSFLLPVRTLSGIQPELINSNRPPHYPGCNGPQAGGWPVGNRVRRRREKERYPPPPPHLHPLQPPDTSTTSTTIPPHSPCSAHNTPTVSHRSNNKHLQ